MSNDQTSLRYAVYFDSDDYTQIFYSLEDMTEYLDNLDYEDKEHIVRLEILHVETFLPLTMIPTPQILANPTR